MPTKVEERFCNLPSSPEQGVSKHVHAQCLTAVFKLAAISCLLQSVKLLQVQIKTKVISLGKNEDISYITVFKTIKELDCDFFLS